MNYVDEKNDFNIGKQDKIKEWNEGLILLLENAVANKLAIV